MWSLIKQNPQYVNEFVADTVEDIALIPTNCAMGSTIICIEDGNVYILNSEKKYVILEKKDEE